MAAGIRHEQSPHGGAFVMEKQGRRVGEMTYRRLDDSRILVDHTYVNPVLRGQGVARQLLDAAVAWARGNGIRMEASCSYVVVQFARDPSLRDVQES